MTDGRSPPGRLWLRRAAVPAAIAAVLLGACEGAPTGPCGGVDCGPHGYCGAVADLPFCVCAAGYYPRGLSCQPVEPANPCAGIDCSGHGTCRDLAGDPSCDCEPGYRHHPSTDLLCLPETPPDADAGVDGDAGMDVDADGTPEVEDDANEAGDGDAAAVCGNGVVEPGEDCDGAAPGVCTGPCGRPGSRSCVACVWEEACRLPAESCNDEDDDCSGVADDGLWCPVGGLPATPDLEAVGGSAADDVWVVGTDGQALRWDGSGWSSRPSPFRTRLSDVWAVSSTEAYAVGDVQTVLAWDGVVWASMAVPSGVGQVSGVWGNRLGGRWAVGTSGVILVPEDVGRWTTVSSYTAEDLLTVWGFGDDVYVAGDAGTLRRWNGLAWETVASGTDARLEAGTASAADEMWIVGAGGTIRRGFGTSWAPSASRTTQDLRDVVAFSPTQAWIVGEAGTILRWDGSSWTASPSGTTQSLRGVWGASADEVWAVGRATTVLRWREPPE